MQAVRPPHPFRHSRRRVGDRRPELAPIAGEVVVVDAEEEPAVDRTLVPGRIADEERLGIRVERPDERCGVRVPVDPRFEELPAGQPVGAHGRFGLVVGGLPAGLDVEGAVGGAEHAGLGPRLVDRHRHLLHHRLSAVGGPGRAGVWTQQQQRCGHGAPDRDDPDRRRDEPRLPAHRPGGRDRNLRHRRDVEEVRVLTAEVQHGRDPLERSATEAEDADAPAAHRLVDAAPVRERLVEPSGERDRGIVADRVLHRGDRVDAAVRERRRRAGEEVDGAGCPGLARVQHDQSRRRLGLVEEVGEPRGR